MRRVQVEPKELVQGEISAKSYKRLMEVLRKLNRKELLKCMDHYLVHEITDANVEELLKILDKFKEGANPSVLAEVTALDMRSETYIPFEDFRVVVRDVVTDEDLQRSANFMDLLYDETFFSYLDPSVRTLNAKKLIEFANQNGVPVQPHWEQYAGADD